LEIILEVYYSPNYYKCFVIQILFAENCRLHLQTFGL